MITLNQPTTSGPVSRRLLAFLAMAIGLIVTLAATTTTTTTASAANFAYDVPGIARVDIRGFEAAGASPTQVSVARDGSASLVVEARFPSTTPTGSVLATECGTVTLACQSRTVHILDSHTAFAGTRVDL